METVFIVDDDAAVRKTLARVLSLEGFGVETFDSAEAFLARLDRETHGCLVLDLTLPGLDGLDLQQRLNADGRSFAIVFLTGHGEIPDTVSAMRAGAVDFLMKPVESATLVAAVRSAIAQEAASRRSRSEHEELEGRLASLTEREREVLNALTEGKLNKQIAAELGIVEQTVKFHRARIMERMQARTAAELMHIAARLGIGR